ncbi:LmeA family phospholipid-binding protein [Nocardia sp. NPDC005978]|uniref:LmeA family phospholipid-binding protein n=2 Tax=unclassified Nocardia TaxID=2637762 RepID=UPI0033B88C83
MRILLAVLIVFAGLAVAADFGAASYAEKAASETMRNTANLGSDPHVDIQGFPVLLQAATGKYSKIVVKADQVGNEKFGLVDVEATLEGVEIPLTDLSDRVLHKLPVDHLETTARFSALRPLALVDVAGLLPFGVTPTSVRMDGTTIVVTGSGDNILIDIDELKGKKS